MATIEVFADIVCPFTYVGLRRLLAARDERGVRVAVRVRAWPLEWVNGRPLAPDKVAHEVTALRRSVAPDLFRGFTAAAVPSSSLPAFGLAASAYERGDDIGEHVSLAVREALFEQGRDLTDVAVLRRIGDRFGVGVPDQAWTAAEVARDHELGLAQGVTGSPHFFVGGQSWFCPSLEIRQDNGEFDVRVTETRLREFYDAALA